MTNDLMEQLGAAAAKVVENGWAAAMLSLWDAGLWLTRLVLHYSEILTTPDLSPDSGPARLLYQTTYWMAAVLAGGARPTDHRPAANRRGHRTCAPPWP